MAAGEVVLFAGAAVLGLRVRGLRLLPVQGSGGIGALRGAALVLGALLVAATPLAIARGSRRDSALRAGVGGLLAGCSAGLGWLVIARPDEVISPLVCGLGVATAVALPPWRCRGRVAGRRCS
ncbi:MAG: hypothetical protein ACR2MA_01770 [Egibacteraceae bacterium]